MTINNFIEYLLGIELLNEGLFLVIIIFNSMPKKVARRKDSDEESEEVEDVMAWGSKKDNYYKDS